MTQELKEIIVKLLKTPNADNQLLACVLLDLNATNLKKECIELFNAYGEHRSIQAHNIYLSVGFMEYGDSSEKLGFAYDVYMMRDDVVIIGGGRVGLLNGALWQPISGHHNIHHI